MGNVGRRKVVEHDETIISMHNQGARLKDISEKVGLSCSTISQRISKYGLKRSYKKRVKDFKKANYEDIDKGKCIALFRAGWSLKNIAKEIELDLSAIVSEEQVIKIINDYYC